MEASPSANVPPEFFVDPIAGSDAASGKPSQPFKTLSHALRQTLPGSVIYLQPGRYDREQGEQFPLHIPPQVVVVGDIPNRGEKVAIVGGGDWESPVFGKQNIALVMGEQSQVQGVTVINPHPKGSGIWIEATAAIAHSTISHCGREGIFVTGEATPIIFDCWVLQNRASGITFTRYAKGVIQRSLFARNRFGITLSDFAAPLIIQGEIIDNQVGIVLSGSSRPILRQNQITANAGEGIVVFSQAAPDLGDRPSPAENYLQGNGDLALRNVGSMPVVTAGNWLHPEAVQGAVELRALQTVHTGSVEAKPLKQPAPPPPDRTPPPVADQRTPSDLVNHWSLPFVREILARRIMGCTRTGLFQPDRPLSRAEFAALMVRAFQPSGDLASQPAIDRFSDIRFRDVPIDHWAAEPIAQAARMGLIAPEADELFSPDEPLSRWQAIVWLVQRLSLSCGAPDNRKTLDSLRIFRDRVEIPSVAATAVAAALAHRLLVLPQRDYPTPTERTDSHRLSPLFPVTRAEIAAWVYQALVLKGEAEPRESPAILMDCVPLKRKQEPMQRDPVRQAFRFPDSDREPPIVAIVLNWVNSHPDPQQQSATAGQWVAQLVERLEQAGIAAKGSQTADRLTEEQIQPALLLQLRLKEIATPGLEPSGLQTQYAPSDCQETAAILHQTLLELMDLPDRQLFPRSELPERFELPDAIHVPTITVEFALLATILNSFESESLGSGASGEANSSFGSYLIEAVQQGLVKCLVGEV